MINGELILRERYNELDDEQYQPTGIDLTLDCIKTIEDTSKHIHGLFKDVKVLPKQTDVNANTVQVGGSLRQVYTLQPNTPYIAVTKEKIKIAPDSAQFYLPRSSLLRAGVSVQTALGDAGFDGHLSFLIINHRNTDFCIEKGARFAQLVDLQAQGVDAEYDGDYNE